MHKIISKRILNPDVEEIVVEAPFVSRKCEPGQFVIIIVEEGGERIPLTIADYNRKDKTITMIYQVVGCSTKLLQTKEVGDFVSDVAGPMGQPAESHHPKRVLGIAGGVGAAPLYPQIKKLFDDGGVDIDVILGGRSKDYVILKEEFSKVSNNVHIATDDGTLGTKGFVTNIAEKLLKDGNKYDEVIAIGPIMMMKAVVEVVRPYDIPISVSLNPLMVDGTGMCGACRVTIAGEVKFACIDGPDFNGYDVDFKEIAQRQGTYKKQEDHDCKIGLNHEKKYKYNMQKEKTPMKELAPEDRKQTFDEVAVGYSVEEAINEAKRCIQCKNPECVAGCPVNIYIPEFIRYIAESDFKKAYASIKKYNSLPAICGRVCPQETQCEILCVRGKKGEPVAIGRLERFIADYAMEHHFEEFIPLKRNGRKVAVIGSGPGGIACAGELAKMGYDTTIFEALHTPGGVLIYGIPEFRLPKEIVSKELEYIKAIGVKIEKNVIIGRSLTLDDLQEDGYEAIFISTGAGLPSFLNIEGENLNGVYSANEFLTRVNLMESYKKETPSPVQKGDRVAVVGGGNVAMDACRTAIRLGAEKVYIIYRRGEEGLPARKEEIEHAKEEGVELMLLSNPVKIKGEDGWVNSIENEKMELGAPDDSGRQRPVAVEGENFTLDVNKVVVAIGQSPNPLISRSTKNLDVQNWGGIVVNQETLETSIENVYAGGDVVTGAATVILAMGAGKKAAHSIDEKLNKK